MWCLPTVSTVRLFFFTLVVNNLCCEKILELCKFPHQTFTFLQLLYCASCSVSKGILVPSILLKPHGAVLLRAFFPHRCRPWHWHWAAVTTRPTWRLSSFPLGLDSIGQAALSPGHSSDAQAGLPPSGVPFFLGSETLRQAACLGRCSWSACTLTPSVRPLSFVTTPVPLPSHLSDTRLPLPASALTSSLPRMGSHTTP